MILTDVILTNSPACFLLQSDLIFPSAMEKSETITDQEKLPEKAYWLFVARSLKSSHQYELINYKQYL